MSVERNVAWRKVGLLQGRSCRDIAIGLGLSREIRTLSSQAMRLGKLGTATTG